MHKLTASKTKKRLKRTNFTASALQIHKRLALPDLKPDAPLQTSTDWPPWSQQSHPEIAKDIGGISTKRSMLKEKYPSDHWIRAFRWISLRSNTRWKRLPTVGRELREMNQKLYGSALHLGITAEFINSLDLTI
ncbi:hypothetical protein RRG08_031631 [Elysia crispata]|uniref:Uncharacterized protein n=1 Tax=Elysia crispata TaxID=231223 RepID=A0AAE1DV69_9GAST|nr:hypothetical protein RRG08_031631 [Elysia crispata]